MVATVLNFKQQTKLVTLTDAATVTPNADTTDLGILTSLSQTTTFANPTGTPTNGQLLQIRITSSTSRAISFGTTYQGASGLILPSATTGGSAEDYIAFRWNSTDSKWDLIATTIGVLANASNALDGISSTQGVILYRSGSAWVALAVGTAGQILSTNGAGANPSWVNANDGWITVQKPSDEGRTSNITNTADGALITGTLTANKTYLLEMSLVVTGTSATGGIKAQFDIPAGASIAGNWTSSTATANVNQPTSASATIATAANQDALQTHNFKGAITVSSTAGTVTFSWAQATSSANTVTVKAGSEINYKLAN